MLLNGFESSDSTSCIDLRFSSKTRSERLKAASLLLYYHSPGLLYTIGFQRIDQETGCAYL